MQSQKGLREHAEHPNLVEPGRRITAGAIIPIVRTPTLAKILGPARPIGPAK
jgi:hypothetical protein